MSDALTREKLDPVEKAQRRFDQAKARLDKARALQTNRTRKQDTHRKILMGAVVLDRGMRDPAVAAMIVDLFERVHLTPRDAAALEPVLARLRKIAPQ